MSSKSYNGNYSFNNTAYDPYCLAELDLLSKRRYLVLIQKGKLVRDEELVESEFRLFDIIKRLNERNIGDGALGQNSFLIEQSISTTASNFTIKGGTAEDPAILIVKGFPLVLFGDIDFNQQGPDNNIEDDAYTVTNITGISVPSANRIDVVYVDTYLAEVSSEVGSEYQDTPFPYTDAPTTPAIKDPVLGLQSANRLRLVQDILVVEGSPTLPLVPPTIPIDGIDNNKIYHRYYQLAQINRRAGDANIYTADITDCRAITTALKEISDGTGNIHISNAIIDEDLTVHGTVTIVNTTQTNHERLVINSSDNSSPAVIITKSQDGDALQINKTSGAGSALIITGGNIGINTPTPAEALTINQGRISIIGNNGSTTIISGNDSSGGSIFTTNNYPLFLGANNNQSVMIMPTTGFVGILTTPTVELDVNGIIKMRGGSPAANNLLIGDVNGKCSWIDQSDISDDDWVKNNQDVYFNKTGNVGINTSTPTDAKLDVAGQIKMRGGGPLASGNVITSDANGIMFWTSQGSLTGVWTLTAENKIYNTAGGNIGINQQNPQNKLVIAAGTSDGISLQNLLGNNRGFLGFDSSLNSILDLMDSTGTQYVSLTPTDCTINTSTGGITIGSTVTGTIAGGAINIQTTALTDDGISGAINITTTGVTNSGNITISTTSTIGSAAGNISIIAGAHATISLTAPISVTMTAGGNSIQVLDENYGSGAVSITSGTSPIKMISSVVSGSCGSITISTKIGSVSSTVGVNGDLILEALATSTSNSGNIKIQSVNTIGDSGDITLSSSSQHGSSGNIYLTGASVNLNAPCGSLVLNGTNATLAIYGSVPILVKSATGNITIGSNATGGITGGNVNIQTVADTTSTCGDINIVSSGYSTSGNIAIATTTTEPGQAGNISLTAGAHAMISLIAPINVNATVGGNSINVSGEAYGNIVSLTTATSPINIISSSTDTSSGYILISTKIGSMGTVVSPSSGDIILQAVATSTPGNVRILSQSLSGNGGNITIQSSGYGYGGTVVFGGGTISIASTNCLIQMDNINNLKLINGSCYFQIESTGFNMTLPVNTVGGTLATKALYIDSSGYVRGS